MLSFSKRSTTHLDPSFSNPTAIRLSGTQVNSAVWNSVGIWWLAIALLFSLTSTTQGQIDSQALEETMVDESSVFVPAPREILRPLFRAEKALREGENERAVELLGALLAEPGYEDFLVKIPGQYGSVTSLRNRALILLGQVPLKDRKLYQLRYGVQAKQLLQQAVAAGDLLQLSSIMQRFFYTQSGYEATMVLGHLHLEQGRPTAAAHCFQRIVETEEARAIHDPEASVLLATCWMLTNAPDKSTQVLAVLAQRSPGQTITFHGKQIQLFQRESEAAGWLRSLIGDSPLNQNRLVHEWVMFRGDPGRNASSGTGFPLPTPRWEVPTHQHPDQVALIEERERELIFSGASTVPATQPLAVGESIVMKSFDQMIGVDFRTGKRTWVFPNLDQTSFFEQEPSRRATKLDRYNKSALVERIWRDHLYGQASSDGRSVFLVPEPGLSTVTSRIGTINRVAVYDPLSRRTYNELMAIEVERQGALKWQVGGETGLDEPNLAKSFFLGPPLPLDGSLLVVCQQDSEIRLVALEPETGRLQWSQHLASTETGGDVVKNANRRLAGVTPSFADGLIICPTGVGAIVAIEIATRSMVWGHQYSSAKDRNASQIRPFFKSSMSATSDPTSKGIEDGAWRDSTVTISQGSVLITPADRQELICFDLLTGAPKWQDKRLATMGLPREDSLFIGCVDRQYVVLIGSESIRAINLETGEQEWRTDTREHGQPSGRGYSNRGAYYSPMNSAKMLKVNLDTGSIENVVETNGVLGNLICYRDNVISQSASRLSAFRQDEPAQLASELALKRGNLSPDEIEIAAQLMAQKHNYENAIQYLENAFALEPRQRYRIAILDFVLQLYEQDVETADRYAEKYFDDLVQDRPLNFWTTRIDGLIKRRKTASAIETLVHFIDSIEKGPLASERSTAGLESDPDSQIVAFDSFVTVRPERLFESSFAIQGDIDIRLDQWIKSRIDMVAPDVSPSQLTDTVTKIYQSRAELLSLSGKFDLASVLRLEQRAPKLAIELANNLAAGEETLRFQLLFEALTASGNATDALTVLAARLNSPPPGITGAISTPEIFQSGNVMVESTDLPVRNPLDVANQQFKRDLNRNRLQLSVGNGDEFYRKFQFRFFGTTGQFQILDDFGNEMGLFPTRQSREKGYRATYFNLVGNVQPHGNLLLIDIGSECFAFDWSRFVRGEDPILWSRNLYSENSPSYSTSNRSDIWGQQRLRVRTDGGANDVVIARPNREGIGVIENNELKCLDLLTGQTKWKLRKPVFQQSLIDDDNSIFVWNEGSSTVSKLDLLTGRLRDHFSFENLGTQLAKQGSRLLLSSQKGVLAAAGKADEEINPQSGKPGKPKYEIVKTLTWYDLPNQKILWQREFKSTTLASVLAPDRVAIFDEDGVVEMLRFGEVPTTEFTTTIDLPEDEIKKITSVEIEEFENVYLIRLIRKGPQASRFRSSINFSFRPLVSNRLVWNGYLMAVDKQTGAPEWKRPAKIHYMQSVPNLPLRSPVCLLIRRVERFNVPTAERNTVHLVAIDLATGIVVANNLFRYVYSADFRVNLDPDAGALCFWTKLEKHAFVFVDELPPPRPIASLNELNSVADKDNIGQSSSFEFQLRQQKFADLRERLQKFQEVELKKKRSDMKRLIDAQRQIDK